MGDRFPPIMIWDLIMSGGIHDPLTPFEAFLVGFFMVSGGAEPCNGSTGTASLGAHQEIEETLIFPVGDDKLSAEFFIVILD